jgi:hypothetical protein
MHILQRTESMEDGTYMEHGIWHMHGTWNMAHRTRNMEDRTQHQTQNKAFVRTRKLRQLTMRQSVLEYLAFCSLLELLPDLT